MAATLINTLGYLFTLKTTWGQPASPRPAPVERSPIRYGRGGRRAWRQTMARAYRGFARARPEWAAALFDEHFLAQRMEARLAESLHGGAPVSALALARAWAEQFGAGRPERRERQVAGLAPAAAEFLDRLAVEDGSWQGGLQFLDTPPASVIIAAPGQAPEVVSRTGL